VVGSALLNISSTMPSAAEGACSQLPGNLDGDGRHFGSDVFRSALQGEEVFAMRLGSWKARNVDQPFAEELSSNCAVGIPEVAADTLPTCEA